MGEGEKPQGQGLSLWPPPSARGIPGQHPVLGLLHALQPYHQEIVFTVAIPDTELKPVLFPTLPLSHD
jgi:hypothetical protein